MIHLDLTSQFHFYIIRIKNKTPENFGLHHLSCRIRLVREQNTFLLQNRGCASLEGEDIGKLLDSKLLGAKSPFERCNEMTNLVETIRAGVGRL